MSGVGEVIAIVSCVAGLIEALDAGHRIVKSIKQRRAAHRAEGALPPSEELEKTIENGKHDIQKLVEKGNKRFGPEFEEGDATAQIAIMRITIQIQNVLLDRLTKARTDDGVVDFEECIDLSDQGCMEALEALQQLYRRKLESSTPKKADAIEQAVPQPEQQQPAAITRVKTTPPTPTRVWVDPYRPQPRQTTSNEHDSPSASSGRKSSSPFGRFRREERRDRPQPTRSFQTAPANISAPLRRSTTVDQSQIRPSASRVSLSSQSSSKPQDHQTARRSTEPQSWTPGMSRASTSLSTSTVTPISRAASGEVAKYGGTCKYAFFTRENGPQGNFEARNIGRYAQHWVFGCKSSKCNFRREIGTTAKTRAHIDDTIHKSNGLQFRWTFLAKSHCQQNTETMNWLYVCLICQLLHDDSEQYAGHSELFAHIATHQEQQVGGVPLEGPMVFNNRGIRADEHFDLQLPEERTISQAPTVSEPESIAEELKAKLKVVETHRISTVSSLETTQSKESSSSGYTDPYANPWV